MMSEHSHTSHIRDAVPSDVDVIHTMVCELAEYEREPNAVTATSVDFHRALFDDSPAAHCFIAEYDGKVAGFALWFRSFSTWQGKPGIYLEDLYVRPQFRGHGLGKALLQRLALETVRRGYGRLEWSVLDWNEPAIGFYTSLGAQAMDEWTKYRLSGDSLDTLAGTNLH